jgi:hypothetical protein
MTRSRAITDGYFQALEKGCGHYLLNTSDKSDGWKSSRWGQKAPEKTIVNGLN